MPRWFDQKILKIEYTTLFTLLSLLLPWPKTPEIWTKNDRISAVFGLILVKPPRLVFYKSVRTCRGGLIKKYWKLNKLHFLHFCLHFYHGQNRPKFGLKMAESRPFLVQLLSNLHGLFSMDRYELAAVVWAKNIENWINYTFYTFVFNFIMVKNARNSA